MATWERAARRRQRRQVVPCRRAALAACPQAGEGLQLAHRGPGRSRASPAAVGAATPSAAAGKAAAQVPAGMMVPMARLHVLAAGGSAPEAPACHGMLGQSMKAGRPPAPASSGAWLDRVWGAQDGGECRQPPAMLDAARRRPGAAGRARPPGGPAARRQSMAGGQQASGARAWPPARRLGSLQRGEAAGTAHNAANCRQQRGGGQAPRAAPCWPGAGGSGRAAPSRGGLQPPRARPKAAWGAASSWGQLQRNGGTAQALCPAATCGHQSRLPASREPLGFAMPACAHRWPACSRLVHRRTRRPATPCGRSACPSWC